MYLHYKASPVEYNEWFAIINLVGYSFSINLPYILSRDNF